MSDTKSKSGVRSLERGLDILLCFQGSNPALSLTEISEKTNLSTSTCDRLLKTLVEQGFLDKDFQKKYSLGSQMYEFINVLSNQFNLQEVSKPILTSLRDTYNETASLYVAQNENRVCIASVESTKALRRTVPVGEVLPMKQGAVGEVFLAYMNEGTRSHLFKDDPYLEEVNFTEIKENGYSINDGKQEEGVLAIAAPIFDSSGSIVAALSLTGPSYRINPRIHDMIKSITFYSNAISHQLGYFV